MFIFEWFHKAISIIIHTPKEGWVSLKLRKLFFRKLFCLPGYFFASSWSKIVYILQSIPTTNTNFSTSNEPFWIENNIHKFKMLFCVKKNGLKIFKYRSDCLSIIASFILYEGAFKIILLKMIFYYTYFYLKYIFLKQNQY